MRLALFRLEVLAQATHGAYVRYGLGYGHCFSHQTLNVLGKKSLSILVAECHLLKLIKMNLNFRVIKISIEHENQKRRVQTSRFTPYVTWEIVQLIPPIEIPSLWNTQVLAASLLMTYPW